MSRSKARAVHRLPEDSDHASGQEASSSAIPESVQQLIALFERELSGVEFPEVGAGPLAQAAAEVEAAVRHCESARAELAAAEEALESSRNAVVRLAERGLAYAKVYAADDAALTEALETIRFGSSRPERAKVPRRRREAPLRTGDSESPAPACPVDSAESSWTN